MASLSKAPLIEVIFEMRWGSVPASVKGGRQEINFEFPVEEADMLPGRFQTELRSLGFNTVERPNQMQQMPHVVMHRFREAPNKWPCYQLGLGIFTANQINDGYKWETFEDTVIKGLTALKSVHETGLSGLQNVGIELRYQDGFVLADGESHASFLDKKLNIQFDVSKDFADSEKFGGGVEIQKLVFKSEVKQPLGIIIVTLDPGFINGKSGFIMNTIVRSSITEQEKILNRLKTWLNEAHEIQRHAFATLIDPTYAKEFE